MRKKWGHVAGLTKWMNMDSLCGNLLLFLFVKYDVDGTKKMQFQQSGLTSGSTVVLTVSNASASTTLVGTDTTQTLILILILIWLHLQQMQNCKPLASIHVLGSLGSRLSHTG